jgi:transcriptional regulator with XRE-family HTH domain
MTTFSDRQQLGRRVVSARVERDWSQKDLAEATGLGITTIQRIETPKEDGPKPTRATLLLLDQAFQVTPGTWARILAGEEVDLDDFIYIVWSAGGDRAAAVAFVEALSDLAPEEVQEALDYVMRIKSKRVDAETERLDMIRQLRELQAKTGEILARLDDGEDGAQSA